MNGNEKERKRWRWTESEIYIRHNKGDSPHIVCVHVCIITAVNIREHSGAGQSRAEQSRVESNGCDSQTPKLKITHTKKFPTPLRSCIKVNIW